MSKATKRIQQEYLNLKRQPLDNIKAAPKTEEDLFNWKGFLKGPPGSPFEDGTFELDIRFPSNYPFKPPTIKFVTKIYHPNISQSSGSVCLDILKDQWAPALTITTVMLSISSLLTDPNPNDPLEGGIAEEYISDREAWERNAREWVKKYATS